MVKLYRDTIYISINLLESLSFSLVFPCIRLSLCLEETADAEVAMERKYKKCLDSKSDTQRR